MSASPPLLATKLYVPRRRPRLVPRPRLIDRLRAALAGQLTLISAPAGFGKTTLLSEWIETGEVPVAWVSLDEGDNDLARFLNYVVAALQTISTSVGESVSIAFQTPRPPPVESVVSALINDVAEIEARFALVLDDYHVIRAKTVHDALAFLLDHLPPQMHVIITTRADPPLPLARLRGRGVLTELRQADLRFTPDEVAAFLNQVMGLDLPTDEVGALAAHTEGWIAGLQMAAVSLQGHADPSRFVKSFTGSNRHVLDYLGEEVLQRQPESLQAFLLQTSILGRMTGPLCDAVTGRDDGEAVLRSMEQSDLFVVPLDDERIWYRYHRLFADLLRKRLRQAQPDIVPTLHRRASVWHEQNGFAAESIDHALSARDSERAAHLIERIALSSLMHSETATLLTWIDALPNDIVRARPRLCAFHAGALLLGSRPLDAVESRLQDAAESDPASRAAGELAVFRALLATFRGDARGSAELSRQALELLPEESAFLRSLAADNLGFAHMLIGDIESAARAFEDAARISQKVGNVANAAGALCNLAGLCMTRGQLHQAAVMYHRALEWMGADSDARKRPSLVTGKALMGLGELAREWNDLEAAERYLTDGIELTGRYMEIGTVVGLMSLMFVRQAQGDVEGAHDVIRRAQQLAVKSDATEFDDILVAAIQARLSVAQGDLETAMRWVEERRLEAQSGSSASGQEGRGASSFPELRELEYLTLARVYVAQGRADEALKVLKPLLEPAEKLKRMRRVVENLTLQALALQVRGDVEDALAVLERVLSLAEPEGYVRVFVDAGRPMAHLLYEAASRGIAPEYAGRLLAAFPDAEIVPPLAPQASAGLVEPLSERELEVLRLIAEGLSNREIAERLVISLSTVKGHTTNIYGKLAVSSRTHAVAKARALGVLPAL